MAKPSVKIESVSPKMAQGYLVKNNDNRPLRDRNVNWFSEQMSDNDWDLVGDCVTFDTNGDLRNGQHRLHAIVQSGKTIDLVVLRGVTPNSFIHMDCPSVRRAGDALAIMGYPHGRKAESAVRMISAISDLENSDETNISKVRWNKMTHTQIVDFAKESEKALLETIYFITDKLDLNRLFGCNNSLFMAMHFVFASKNKSKAKEFFTQFADESFFEEEGSGNNAVYDLQEKLYKIDLGKKNVNTQFKAMMFVQAWNAFLRNENATFNITKTANWPEIASKMAGKTKTSSKRKRKAA